MAQPAPDAPEAAVQVPPEQISMDTILAEYGMTTIQLNAANRRVVALTQENAQLRAANQMLTKALETKQLPTGVPAGSAPRAQRRAADKAKLAKVNADLAKAKASMDAQRDALDEVIASMPPVVEPTPITRVKKPGG